MHKHILLIILLCSCLFGYNQNRIQAKNDSLATNQLLEFGFGKGIKAPDLHIKSLSGVYKGDSVLFTIRYSSGKDRFLSFFNPPFGTVLMYFNRNGIKKDDSIATFCIAKKTLHSIYRITMRFSTNDDSEKDRNFIYLKASDPKVKEFLGLSNKNRDDYKLFSKIFDLPDGFGIIIALCFLVPLLLYFGNNLNFYSAAIKRRVTNKWLSFNINTLIFSIIIAFLILLFSKNLKTLFPLKVYLNLIIIILLSANLSYLGENIIFKSWKRFWLREYISLVLLICGLYFIYKICDVLTGEIISHLIISTAYVLLGGMVIGSTRLINNYITNQKIVALKEKELELSRLNELKTRSDLTALQSKINPHFLYNALNSIAELCWKDPEKTEHMALNLAKLFRYSVNKEESDFNSLKNEIEIVDLYLSVEKERFGNNLTYQFKYNRDIENILIPKFILQPLIENAIKHGISKNPNVGQIKLDIKTVKNNLEIRIYDNGPDFPLNFNTGYGLKSIYDKLDILYPKRYSIELHNGIDKNITIILKDAV